MSRIAFDYKPRATASRTAAHTGWFVSGVLAPLIGGAIVYAIATHRTSQVTAARSAIESVIEAPIITMSEIASPPIPQPIGDTVEFVVRRNDTLDRIFRQMDLNLTELASIRELPGVQQSLDQLRPGETITLIHDAGALQSLRRRVNDTEILSVTRATTASQPSWLRRRLKFARRPRKALSTPPCS